MSTPTRTPTRAIVSTLLTTPTSQIPPSSQSYDPLIKHVLSRRLTREVFPTSFGLCVVFWWLLGGGGINLSWYGLGSVLLGWSICAVPVAISRKRAVKADRTPARNPRQSFRLALKNRNTMSALGLHAMSSLLMIVLDTSYVRMFANSRKHPYYLNPQFLTLIICQILLAVTYLGRNILLDRYVLKYPRTSSSSTSKAVTPLSLLITLLTSTVLSALALLLTLPALTLVLPCLTFILPVLRPFIGHVGLKVAFWVRWTRVSRLALCTVWAWETVDGLMDIIIPKPIPVTAFLPPSNQLPALVAGITSPDPTFRYYAYRELKDIASGADQRSTSLRSTLFTSSAGTTKTGSSITTNVGGTLWGTLVRECLLQLGKDYQHLIRRGAPAPAPPPPVAVPTNLTSTPQKVGKEIHLKKDGSIFRGSPAPSPAAGPSAPPSTLSLAPDDEEIVPSIFRSVNPTPTKAAPPASSAAPAAPPKAASISLSAIFAKIPVGKVTSAVWRRIHSLLPRPAVTGLAACHEWWTKDREAKVVDCMVPRREVDVLIIEALAHLISHSLAQDSYGVVQRNRDIPRVVEAFCSLFSEIRTVKTEVLGSNPSPEDPAVQSALPTASLDVVEEALKDGLSLIIRTFGDKLWKSYKFPARTVDTLTSFGFMGQGP